MGKFFSWWCFFVLFCYKNTHRKTKAWWKSCVFLSDEFKLCVSSSLELTELTDFFYLTLLATFWLMSIHLAYFPVNEYEFYFLVSYLDDSLENRSSVKDK